MSLLERVTLTETEKKKKKTFKVAPKADWIGKPRNNMLNGLKSYKTRLGMMFGANVAEGRKHKIVGKIWHALDKLEKLDRDAFGWLVANYNGGAPLHLSDAGLKKHFDASPPASGTTEWVPASVLRERA